MADPFSVTGSAVGVISLGLTICQGLRAYYGPFKSFHTQIEEITYRIASLEGILKALNDVLIECQSCSHSSTSQPLTVAIRSILGCQEGLDRLKETLEKCTHTKITHNQTGSRITMNRILYPFRRETLITLMETMSWLHDNLNTSLLMLTVSTITTNKRQTDLIMASSISNASDTSRILNVAQSLNTSTLNIDHRLDQLEQHMSQVVWESSLSLHGARTTTQRLPTQFNLKTKEVSDNAVRHPISPRARKSRIRCTCPHRNQSAPLNWGACQQAVTSGICPLHGRNKQMMLVFRRWNLCKWTFQISLAIEKGSQGFSICPNLQFRPVVPADSPIFSLLLDTENALKSQDTSLVMRIIQEKLFALFAAGEGGYLDTLPDGKTILHVIASWQKLSRQWDNNSWLCWSALINSLLQAGMSPDRVDDDGGTPADAMIKHFTDPWKRRDSCQQQVTIQICSDLLNSGGYMTHMALDWRYHRNVFNLFYFLDSNNSLEEGVYFEDYSARLIWKLADEKELQDIDLPEELLPLINRSSEHLKLLLEKGIDLRPWISCYAQWPTGLALLLQYGYTPTSQCLRTACEANCERGVELLIDTGKGPIGKGELEVAGHHHNPKIVKLVVEALARHRRRLQFLAETYLPHELISPLHMRPDSLLSIGAFKVYRLLKDNSIHIDTFEECFSWSVYECVSAGPKFADLLWDVGFRDVDEADEADQTCLMRLGWILSPTRLNSFLERADWLIMKGADEYKKARSSPALHFLGQDVGRILCFMETTDNVILEMNRLSGRFRELLRRIIVDKVRDDCCCACSRNGCSGLTRILNGLCPYRFRENLQNFIPRLALMLKSITQSLEPEVQDCVLRFITCLLLEITHTCGHYPHDKKSDEEIMEIHDEERLLIRELDELLAEFSLESKRLALPFPDFLTGYWLMRANEILSSRGDPSEEEISRIRKTGVILHD